MNGIEPYDSIEEGIDVLNKLDKEFTQTMIELEASMYLDKLVLESMMYEDFNEEKLVVTMEETEEKQKRSIGEILQAQWEKIKAWFANIIQTISNFFVNGEKLVKENEDKIPQAIKNCNVKVKMNVYNPYSGCADKIKYMIDKLKNVARQKGMSKEKLTSIIGAKDKGEVAGLVKKIIVKEEGKEMMVSDIDPKVAMEYVGSRKSILDLCNTLRKIEEDYYKWAKAELKESGEDLTTFNFAISLKNAILTANLQLVKKACSDYLIVIRKALGGKSEDGDKENKKAFGKKGEDDDALKKTMTPKIEELIKEKDVLALKIALKNRITLDPSFKEFDALNKYIKKHGIELYEKHDGKAFEEDSSKWDKDYMNTELVRLVTNFSVERVNQLRKVVKVVYKDRL
jgi:hypothetical protein